MINRKIRKSKETTVTQLVVLMLVLVLVTLTYAVSLSIGSVKAATLSRDIAPPPLFTSIQGRWVGNATPNGKPVSPMSININSLQTNASLPDPFSGDLTFNNSQQKGTIKEAYTDGSTVTFLGTLAKCRYTGKITDVLAIDGFWFCPDGRKGGFHLNHVPS